VDVGQADAAFDRLFSAAETLNALRIRSFDLIKAMDDYHAGEAARLGTAVSGTEMDGMYYVLEGVPDGWVTRGRLSADGQLGLAAVRARTVYKLSLFDPRDWLWGSVSFLSAEVGRTTPLPHVLLVPFDDEPDADADGLPDLAEWILGTDRANPDTSGDGIRDGDAVRLGLDPLGGRPVRTGVIASAPTSAPAIHIAVEEGVAVTANGMAGITVFEAANPWQPSRVAQVDTPGNAVAVATALTHDPVEPGFLPDDQPQQQSARLPLTRRVTTWLQPKPTQEKNLAWRLEGWPAAVAFRGCSGQRRSGWKQDRLRPPRSTATS
jgi:hypothetical protein